MNTGADSNEEGAELQAVMGDYFDALLHDSAESPAPSVAVETLTIAAAALPSVDPVAAPAVEDAAAHSETPAEQVSGSTVGTPDTPIVVEPETVVAAAEQPAAEPGYRLIRIGTLTLGIPTHAITDVVTDAAHWAPPGAAPATVLGSYSSGTATYTVVDTAALLIPGTALQAAAVGRNAVLLTGERWALACDGIGEVVTPDPAQVNWRGAQGKRPWLAGTLRDPVCALLDIPELLRLLAP